MIRSAALPLVLATAALAFAAPAAQAAPTAPKCSATVDSTDAMQFTTKALTVPKACTTFTITLRHTGKLAKTVMGHNLVLGKASDIAGITTDGMKAGAAAQYVKAGDARVLAATKLIGGGESATVKIPVAKLKAGQAYEYVCTFPGHSALMKGTLKLGA